MLSGSGGLLAGMLFAFLPVAAAGSFSFGSSGMAVSFFRLEEENNLISLIRAGVFDPAGVVLLAIVGVDERSMEAPPSDVGENTGEDAAAAVNRLDFLLLSLVGQMALERAAGVEEIEALRGWMLLSSRLMAVLESLPML